MTEEQSMESKRKELKGSFDMYERTIAEAIDSMSMKTDPEGRKMYSEDDIEDHIKMLRTAQKDIISQYINYGGDENDLKIKKHKALKKLDRNMIVLDKDVEMDKPITTQIEIEAPTVTNITKKEEYSIKESFDVIPLPSNGECYKNKIGKVQVSYLTAWDENVITAPNLYNDNSVIDVILSRKIMDKGIDPDLLTEGDREAIIFFLRATGYGNEYPVSAIDDKTGIEFDTIVDLSKLQYKPFTLKGDENGWFDFTLPGSKDEIKFRFLTHKDIKALNRLEEIENKKFVKTNIGTYIENLDTYIENDDTLENTDKVKVRLAIRDIEKWYNKMSGEEIQYTHGLSNNLEYSIMSINGNTDRQFIHDYIKSMRAMDSLALRKYIKKNEPGIDYTIEVERPESLGGGSFKTFLQYDKFIFLNQPE